MLKNFMLVTFFSLFVTLNCSAAAPAKSGAIIFGGSQEIPGLVIVRDEHGNPVKGPDGKIQYIKAGSGGMSAVGLSQSRPQGAAVSSGAAAAADSGKQVQRKSQKELADEEAERLWQHHLMRSQQKVVENPKEEELPVFHRVGSRYVPESAASSGAAAAADSGEHFREKSEEELADEEYEERMQDFLKSNTIILPTSLRKKEQPVFHDAGSRYVPESVVSSAAAPADSGRRMFEAAQNIPGYEIVRDEDGNPVKGPDGKIQYKKAGSGGMSAVGLSQSRPQYAAVPSRAAAAVDFGEPKFSVTRTTGKLGINPREELKIGKIEKKQEDERARFADLFPQYSRQDKDSRRGSGKTLAEREEEVRKFNEQFRNERLRQLAESNPANLREGAQSMQVHPAGKGALQITETDVQKSREEEKAKKKAKLARLKKLAKMIDGDDDDDEQ